MNTYNGVNSIQYQNYEKKYKKLGGKNGKLKCDCGNLRYKGVTLCPECYKKQIKYYVCRIDTEEHTGTKFDNTLHLLSGISIENALYKAGFKNITYDSEHYTFSIPRDLKEFDNRVDAENYFHGEMLNFGKAFR